MSDVLKGIGFARAYNFTNTPFRAAKVPLIMAMVCHADWLLAGDAILMMSSMLLMER